MIRNREFVRQTAVGILFLAIIIFISVINADYGNSKWFTVCIIIFLLYFVYVTVNTLIRYRNIKKLSTYLYALQDTEGKSSRESLHTWIMQDCSGI